MPRAAGVVSGGARGMAAGGILDWPEEAKANEQAPPARGAPAGHRAYHLAAAAAVAAEGDYRTSPKAPEAPAADDLLVRKRAFLAGQAQPAELEAAGRIGAGAFAVVRLVAGPDGKPVALKTYEGIRDHPGKAEHARNEVALAGRLRHPNLIAPRAVRREGPDCVVLEMEYAAGGSLSELVKRVKYVGDARLGEPEACGLSSACTRV